MQSNQHLDNNLLNIIDNDVWDELILKIKQIFLEENNLNSKLDIKEKSHQDYVTNLDIKIQKYLIKKLNLIFIKELSNSCIF